MCPCSKALTHTHTHIQPFVFVRLPLWEIEIQFLGHSAKALVTVITEYDISNFPRAMLAVA
jgi:hypothetical protein